MGADGGPRDRPFDYRTATKPEILARAQGLVGLTLGEISGARFDAVTGGTGRQEVGHAAERYFGIPRNSRHEADFPAAGVELKVVPLRRTRRGIDTKERTVLTMIDYNAIVSETWSTATVRSKLNILFVFFEHLPGRPKNEFPIRAVRFWTPTGDVERFIRSDWLEIQRKVRLGHAHLLTEADGRIMGPCTKAADSKKRRKQPFSDEPAKPRAFALKQAFVKTLYVESRPRAAPSESLVANLDIKRVDHFERGVIDHFTPYIGATVAEAGDALAVPRSRSKNYAATVARMALGARTPRRPIEEFEYMGLNPRIVRCNPDRKPYEGTSFPRFSYQELIKERWEESDLLARIEYMLLVPVVGTTKGTPAAACRFDKPVFWRPTLENLETIRQEWELYVKLIAEGKADQLPGYSQTRAIHVRPHGNDSSDTDDAPVIGPVVKKSFWLNPRFVHEIFLGRA